MDNKKREQQLIKARDLAVNSEKKLRNLLEQLAPIITNIKSELQNLHPVISCLNDELGRVNPMLTQLCDLDLEVRTYNTLKGAGIHTVGDLIKKTDEELLSIKLLGKKTLKEIKTAVEEWKKNIPKTDEPMIFITDFNVLKGTP